MNLAHIHLILNHIPMLTMPVVLVFFLFALWTQNKSLKKFSLILLVATAGTVVPVYLTGEPAEKVVEHFASLSEPLIEAHEESAEVSLILTLVAGGLALASLLTVSRLGIQKFTSVAVVVITALAVGSLGYTANLGGKIRHSELLSKQEAEKANSEKPAEKNEANEKENE